MSWKRPLLVLAINTAGMAALLWLAGGWAGPGRGGPPPQFQETQEIAPGEGSIVPPLDVPVAVSGFNRAAGGSAPEAIEFVDEESGETVFVPFFVRYQFEAREGGPTNAGEAGRQAAELRGLRLRMYREPRTLEEARALADGREGAQEALLKWHVFAEVAVAKFLMEGLSLSSRRSRPDEADAVIHLREGVLVRDVEERLVIQGEDLELQPTAGQAKGRGVFVVRHDTFEITGRGLEVSREESSDRIALLEDVVVNVHGTVPGPDGRPLLDLGDQSIEPGTITAEGGAVLVRETVFGIERLQLELRHRVHAEQTNGRSLDAERIQLVAHRDPGEPGSEAKDLRARWKLHSFLAEGGAIVEYPDVTKEGRPYLVSATAHRILHEVAADGTASTLLDGEPQLALHGDIPLSGLDASSGLGILRASAHDQAWMGTADPADLPPGADPAQFVRIVLRGDARLERQDTGLSQDWERLEGEQLTVLFKKAADVDETVAPGVTGTPTQRLVAVSFFLFGDVELTGTRMNGRTQRLRGEALDTNSPSLTAEGLGTRFAFHGLRQDQRFLGGSNEARTASTRGDGLTDAGPREDWVLERIRAGGGAGDLVVQTSFGGPTVGVPTRVSGRELAYDRVTDRARLQGSASSPARVTVGEPGTMQHAVTANSMVFQRERGEIEARGSVRGTVYVVDARGGAAGLAALGLEDPQAGTPVTFGVATDGRIVIRGMLTESLKGPLLDADQIVRIEGGVVAEMVSEETAVDSLRADFVEVALRRTVQEVSTAPSASVAAAPRPRRNPTATKEREPAPAARPVRWDLSSEILRARVGPGGFESVEAVEGATLSSDDATIRGRRIAYDGLRQEVSVRGEPGRDARAAFGTEKERNEVWAQDLLVHLATDGPDRVDASAGARAVLIRKGATEKQAAMERFTVLCTAPVRVTRSELVTENFRQAFEIRRHVRPIMSAPWGDPARLWANRLVVRGSDLLSGNSADVTTVTASGPDTALKIGAGDSETTVWGERFELEIATSLATLTGTPEHPLEIQRGRADAPQGFSRQNRIVLDLKTGMFRAADQVEIIIPGNR